MRPYRLFALSFAAVAFGALNSVLSSAYLPDIIAALAPGADEGTRGTIGAFVNFAFLIGGALGGIAMGFLSDRIGRRDVLALALLCCGAGSGLGAMAGNWELLAVTRALVGVGVGAALVVSAVIVAEAWEARTRAVMLGILSVAYPVGIIGSGLVTASVPSWRMAFLAGALCALLAWPVRVVVRDSARWVAESSETREAVWSSHRGTLWSGMLVYGSMLLGLWAAFSWLPTWVQSLLATDGTSGQAERGGSVALLGAGGLVGGIASGWLANAFGRKRVQSLCFVLCLMLSYLLFEASTVYSVPVMAGIALLGLTFGVSQGVLNSYVPELFPAAVRSAATALCFHVGRIFTAVAVFFVGSLVVWFGGYGHAIFAFSLTYVVGLVALYRTRRAIAQADALGPVG